MYYTSQITADNNYFTRKISNKLNLYDRGFVNVVQSFLMLKIDISKQIFERIF